MSKPVPVRLDEREQEKLEELVTMFQNIAPGKVTKSDIIRYAINELYAKKTKTGSYESN